jgi:hypothetical protein
MVATTLLTGIDMTEDEYRETLAHSISIPAEWAEVWDARNEGTRVPEGGALESEALPGFRLELARLWAAIDSAPA